MITLPSRASLSLVADRVERAIAVAAGAFPPERSAPLHDPVFLPDTVSLMPDQAQELRYGLGRDR